MRAFFVKSYYYENSKCNIMSPFNLYCHYLLGKSAKPLKSTLQTMQTFLNIGLLNDNSLISNILKFK